MGEGKKIAEREGIKRGLKEEKTCKNTKQSALG